MRLTKNFTLSEMTRSQTATRRDIDNTPDKEAIKRLKTLCNDILQPLREQVGIITISSGYRSPKLNKAIRGSKTSQHRFGEAADLHVTGFAVPEIVNRIIELNLPFHQLIDEFSDKGGGWVHVSIAPKGRKPKKQVMTARRGRFGKTKYTTVSIG